VGGELEQSSLSGDWVRLQLDGASDIAFQRDPDHQAPDWPDGAPQQAHLDLDVPDLDAAERELLAIGAVKAERQPKPDRWRVFLDPAGHPFCLIKV
jgi:hypothetical protein